MDKTLNELMSLTQDVIGRMPVITYEELEEFLDKRGALISTLIEMDVSGEADMKLYKASIESVLAYDSLIQDRMNHLKLQASSELIKLQTTRKQKSGYDSADNTESLFYDQRN
ncbi:hypothetical protein [Paenibacillus eucommiae]|uniref:Flagellar protein FliT n=1 Tax=Paenibacillus eucommiae TaxID=1355755 RepID=A0ABS4IYI2_9BACL|nr:hypothetical protein [Paenibacillus eucommiae]MBP1992652.1 hypothetical protein [Paenibacillus eucommiae]